MINSLPTELVLLSCQYLSYEEVETLAWTNRRFMQIVIRNLPTALQPRISIDILTISPLPAFYGEGLFALTVNCKSKEGVGNHDFTVPACIREAQERQQFAEDDRISSELFLRWYQFCRRELKKNIPFDQCTQWEDFYKSNMKGLNKTEPFNKAVPLSQQLFVRFNVKHFSIARCTTKQFWQVTEAFGSARGTFRSFGIQSQHVHFDMPDMVRCENSSFLRIHPPYLMEIPAPVCTIATLSIPLFENTLCCFNNVSASEFERLPFVCARRVHIDRGFGSFRQFFENFFIAAPVVQEWQFCLIENSDRLFGWDVLETILNSVYPDVQYDIINISSHVRRYKIISSARKWDVEIKHFDGICRFDLKISKEDRLFKRKSDHNFREEWCDYGMSLKRQFV